MFCVAPPRCSSALLDPALVELECSFRLSTTAYAATDLFPWSQQGVEIATSGNIERFYENGYVSYLSNCWLYCLVEKDDVDWYNLY